MKQVNVKPAEGKLGILIVGNGADGDNVKNCSSRWENCLYTNKSCEFFQSYENN